MRPNTHFNEARWKLIITRFKEQTGHTFIKAQLKNK
jgi:hypothetical protein